MKNVSGRLFLVCLIAGLTGAAGVAEGAKYYLIAVEVDGVPRPLPDPWPAWTMNNVVDVLPGQSVVCEIWGSDWNHEVNMALKSWEARLDGSGYTNAGAGVVRPRGWAGPIPPIPCEYDFQCPAEYPTCTRRICVDGPHTPEDGATIDTTKPEFVYYLLGSLISIDTATLNYRYGATLFQTGDCPPYDPDLGPRYMGTLILDVEATAVGQFDIEFDPLSEMRDCPNGFPIEPIELVGLTIDTGVGVCIVESTNPDNCYMDARQPSQPDGSDPAGHQSIDFTFNPDCDVNTLRLRAFSVSEVPDTGIPISVDSMDLLPLLNRATVNLSRRISLGVWTCVTYNSPDPFEDYEVCIAHLPGDATSDRTSAPSDILRVIDCINGVATCEMHQGDIDRSDVIAPPDILRVIDLLNGAGVYEPWLNVSIDPCPTAP